MTKAKSKEDEMKRMMGKSTQLSSTQVRRTSKSVWLSSSLDHHLHPNPPSNPFHDPHTVAVKDICISF